MEETHFQFDWHIKESDLLGCSVHGYPFNPNLTGCYLKISTGDDMIFPCVTFYLSEQQLINLKNNLISECDRYMAKYRGK